MTGKGNGFSIIDPRTLSKPLSKLIDAIRSGVGVLYEPRRIRRRAEAEAKIVLFKADLECRDLAERAARRLGFQELRRQQNIDAIVEGAAEALPQTVSAEPVDPDWVSRFFQECQDVSNEQLQQLWSHLLAKEVGQPGSCSRRTLSVLQSMSPADAATFRRACSLVWVMDHDGALLFTGRVDETGRTTASVELAYDILQKDYALSYDDLINLDSLGLLHLASDTAQQWEPGDRLSYAGIEHVVLEKRRRSRPIHCLALTRSGLELYHVSSTPMNEEYYRAMLYTLLGEYDLRVGCPLNGGARCR